MSTVEPSAFLDYLPGLPDDNRAGYARPNHSRLNYDARKFDFVGAVSEILNTENLQELGKQFRLTPRVRTNDQVTPWHDIFYREFDGKLSAIYVAFVSQIAARYYKVPFYFQAVPTLRIHLPGNRAVGEFHTDRRYGHPPGEHSFWVPLTPAFATNTVLIESSPDSGDHQPIEAVPGELIVFDSGRLEHGNVINETTVTRVSFDFRCLPVDVFVPSNAVSVNTGMRFVPGQYYARESVEGSRLDRCTE